MRECRDQLNLALFHADAMVNSKSVTPASMTSIWQLTSKALCKVTALKSEICGNEPPKIG